MVVAQAVERQHSVRASRVQILGWTWLFRKCNQSIFAGRWAFSKERIIKWHLLFFLLCCFLSFKHCKCINCIVPMNQEKENKNPKRGRERPTFLKVRAVLVALGQRARLCYWGLGFDSRSLGHPSWGHAFFSSLPLSIISSCKACLCHFFCSWTLTQAVQRQLIVYMSLFYS